MEPCNKVLLCGDITSNENKNDEYYISSKGFDYGKSTSRNNFQVECIFKNGKKLNPSILKQGKVTAIGNIVNNNIVNIEHIKIGYTKEKNISLLSGQIISNTQSHYSGTWHFDLKVNKKKIKIYLPNYDLDNNHRVFRSNDLHDSSYDPYNIKDFKFKADDKISLIGFLSAGHVTEERPDNLSNSVYIFYGDFIPSPCPIKIMNNDITKETIDDFSYEFISIKNSLIKLENTISTYNNKLDGFKAFFNTVKNSNKFYSSNDLLNFFTAMKSKGLVILSGLSGVGKTQLVNIYAKSLNISPKRFLHISVKPNWINDSSLLGFLNPATNTYYPSSTGLVDTLKDAAEPENRDKEYIILLDEMNLSQIEYYFSQFLSILEYDYTNPKRCIKLFDNVKRDNDNFDRRYKYHKSSNDYPPYIHIGSNVKFVGTVNIDESTKLITDKVLDRTNLINLPTISSSKIFNGDKNFAKEVTSIEASRKISGLTTSELKLLYDIDKILQSHNNKLGIGWRDINQINDYLYNLPDFYSLSDLQSSFPYKSDKEYRGNAFDVQLSQRVLDKITGTRNNIFGAFKGIENKLNQFSTNEDSKDYIDTKFQISKSIIRNKKQEINNYGRTI